MPSSTPLSYQTTMPEYPDVSYTSWQNSMNVPARLNSQNWSRAGWSMFAHMNGHPSYDTWRTNLLDDYNAKMSAYNTWLSTGEGIRRSAESGSYNPSYFDGGSASASPLSFQDVNEGSGFSEMAQGISGIFNFAQALLGMRSAVAQISGLELKNKQLELENEYLDKSMPGRLSSLNYQNDMKQFELEQLFFPRWSSRPEYWKGGVFSPYGRGTYDLEGADLGFGYRRQAADIGFLQAGKALKEAQTEMSQWNSKEKKWFSENMWEIQKKILDGQYRYLDGEIKWQPIRQKLQKSAQRWGIGLNVVNTALRGVSIFTPFGRAVSSGKALFNPAQFTTPYSPLGSGMDLSGYGAFGSY